VFNSGDAGGFGGMVGATWIFSFTLLASIGIPIIRIVRIVRIFPIVRIVRIILPTGVHRRHTGTRDETRLENLQRRCGEAGS
jgi:hypothetical protein